MTPAQFHRLARQVDTRQKSVRRERERICAALHGLGDLLTVVYDLEPQHRFGSLEAVLARLEALSDDWEGTP